jgi:hypothetical protein
MHYTSESYTRGECLSEGVSVTAPVFYEDIVRFESIQVHFFITVRERRSRLYLGESLQRQEQKNVIKWSSNM